MFSEIWRVISKFVTIIGTIGGLIYIIVNYANEQVQINLMAMFIIGAVMMVINKFRKPPTKKD